MPICCSGCARAAYLFALVLQLVLGLRPGRRHMRLFSNALRRGVCRCAVASNPFLHVVGISWSEGRWVEARSQVVVIRKERAAWRVQNSRRAGLLYRVSSHEVS